MSEAIMCYLNTDSVRARQLFQLYDELNFSGMPASSESAYFVSYKGCVHKSGADKIIYDCSSGNSEDLWSRGGLFRR